MLLVLATFSLLYPMCLHTALFLFNYLFIAMNKQSYSIEKLPHIYISGYACPLSHVE